MRAIAIAAACCAACTSKPIGWVAPFVHEHLIGPMMQTQLAATASDAGNAIVFLAGCESPSGVVSAGISTSRWPLAYRGPAAASGTLTGAVFGGFAADAQPIEITLFWSGPCERVIAIGDEFSDVGTFEMSTDIANIATGSCATTAAPPAHDALWAACYSNGGVSAVGAGFTKGADDNFGDWTQYALAPAPTQVTFDVSGASSAIIAPVALRPR